MYTIKYFYPNTMGDLLFRVSDKTSDVWLFNYFKSKLNSIADSCLLSLKRTKGFSREESRNLKIN
jgi:hypothetical protein